MTFEAAKNQQAADTITKLEPIYMGVGSSHHKLNVQSSLEQWSHKHIKRKKSRIFKDNRFSVHLHFIYRWQSSLGLVGNANNIV